MAVPLLALRFVPSVIPLKRRLALCCAVFVLTVACDGPDGPMTPGTTQPPAEQTINGTVAVFGATFHPLSIPRTGQMSLTLTWTDPTINLDLYLAPPGCTQFPPTAGCDRLAASNTLSGVALETIARSVVGGETYTVWVENLNRTQASTYTLRVTIQ
jgi:hypothetical protein